MLAPCRQPHKPSVRTKPCIQLLAHALIITISITIVRVHLLQFFEKRVLHAMAVSMREDKVERIAKPSRCVGQYEASLIHMLRQASCQRFARVGSSILGHQDESQEHLCHATSTALYQTVVGTTQLIIVIIVRVVLLSHINI